jgi:hypothetical protein
LRQPTDDFADQAWAILMARLNNDRSPTLQTEVHSSLVIRESTVLTRKVLNSNTLDRREGLKQAFASVRDLSPF